jgi:5-methylcytosine-specific restriction enzyme B
MTKHNSNQVFEIVNELATTKSVVLEGPPGTGKTYQVQEIVDELRKRIDATSANNHPIVRTRDSKHPFGSLDTLTNANSEGGLRTEWVTFHESFTYEEFILGRRPEPIAGGVRLVAYAGVLLDLAISVDPKLGKFNAAVVVIDEINRANAGRVLGEFMTLLDGTYRATIDGLANTHAISPRLAGLRYEEDGLSEKIVTLDGQVVRLPIDWLFPENIYVVATMNSVDKGALPLDSALLRRFKRFYIGPNKEVLANHIKASAPSTDQKTNDLVCSLFVKINEFILASLGRDQVLGHALFWDVVREGQCNTASISRVWDRVVLPQLLDRFIFNTGMLSDLLHRNLDSYEGLMEIQQVSDWNESDALSFFRSIVDDNLS